MNIQITDVELNASRKYKTLMDVSDLEDVMTNDEVMALKRYWKKEYERQRQLPEYKKMQKIRSKRHYLKHPFGRFIRALKYSSKKQCIECQIKSNDLWRIAKKQKLKCALTNRKLTTENISLDHIHHLSKGGLNTIDNIRFVTVNVNFARRCLTDKEFVEMCQDVVNKQSIPTKTN